MNSDLGGYEQIINNLSAQIKSFESYKCCVKYLFIDEKFNYGRIKVWFHFTKYLYPKISSQKQNEMKVYVQQCFVLFENKCKEYQSQLLDMKEDWDDFSVLYKI